jgi:hypothetical protein
MTKDKSRRWTWQVGDKNLLEALLYDHLYNHQWHGQKQLILKALTAFYGPLACMEDETISFVDRQEIYKSARYDLQRQLELLDRLFLEQNITTQMEIVASEPSSGNNSAPPQLSFSALME